MAFDEALSIPGLCTTMGTRDLRSANVFSLFRRSMINVSHSGTSVKLGVLPISINDILEAFKSCLRIDSG